MAVMLSAVQLLQCTRENSQRNIITEIAISCHEEDTSASIYYPLSGGSFLNILHIA